MATALSKRLEGDDGRAILKELAELSQDESGDLPKHFEALSQQKANKLWGSIAPAVNLISNELRDDSLEEEKQTELISLLTAASVGLKAFLSSASTHRPPALSTIVLKLSNTFCYFNNESECSSGFRNSLSGLFETYIKSREPGYEQLLSQSFVYLLKEASKPDVKDSVMKRLVAIKDSLQLLDYSHPDNSACRDLLLRCFVNPCFIKSVKARELLSDLLAVSHGALCSSACQVIKVQVSAGSHLLAAQYGTILQNTWKDHSSQSTVFQKKFQDSLQDFVHEAVHADGAKRFKGLRHLLKAFHETNRPDAFNQLLVDVYDPIIWRALRCANAAVRSQAAVVFLDVFPLVRVSANPEECDQLLQKEFDQLISLLKDGDQRVRGIATTGVCHILREYWDMLPAATVHNILKYIFDTLAFDTSCANVRHAVITGIEDLLQQPMSHKALKNLLPLLKNYIHDKSDKVRLAFVQLLRNVKSLQDIVYYEVVPVEHLLARLAEDREDEQLVFAMTDLLMNSYFPQTTTEKYEKVQRCMQMIQANPLAAEAFYSHLHKFSSVGAITKLAAMLFSLLLVKPKALEVAAPVGEKTAAKRRRGGAKKGPVVPVLDESNLDLSVMPTIPDPTAFLRVLRLVVAILRSIQAALPNHASSLELLVKYLSVANLQQLMIISCNQGVHTEHIVACALQLLAIINNVMHAAPALDANLMKEEFSIDFLLQQTYLPMIQFVQNCTGGKVLAGALVETASAFGLQAQLLSEVQRSLTLHLQKKSKSVLGGASLSLSNAADILTTVVDVSCSSLSEEVDKSVADKLTAIWTALQSLELTMLSGHGKPVSESDQKAVLQMTKCWIAHATFSTTNAAVLGLLPEHEHDAHADISFGALIDWMTNHLPSPQSALDIAEDDAKKCFALQLLCVKYMALVDALTVLPAASNLDSIAFVLSRDLASLASALDDRPATGPHQVREELHKKCLIVCDRLCMQWTKLNAQLPQVGFADMTTAVIRLLSTCAAFVRSEDTAQNSMYQRCMKVIGVKSTTTQPKIREIPSQQTDEEEPQEDSENREQQDADEADERMQISPVKQISKPRSRRGVQENQENRCNV